MKKIIVLIFLLVPCFAFASDCCPSEKGDTQPMMHHSGDSMTMAGGMMMLGEQHSDGVKAMAHLKDVRSAMADAGMPTTHHLMVMFSEVANGEAIDGGKVAVKVTSPDGTQQPPLPLIGMQGHFGVDLTLDQAGPYQFVLGTVLTDSKKRVFTFNKTLD